MKINMFFKVKSNLIHHQEQVMIQKHKILGTTIFHKLLKKIVASNTMRITSPTLRQKLLLWKFYISNIILLANSQNLLRYNFFCRVVIYSIAKWVFKELLQRPNLILHNFRVVECDYCHITEFRYLPPPD